MSKWTHREWDIVPASPDLGEGMFACLYIEPRLADAEEYIGPICHVQSCEHIGGIRPDEARANAQLIAEAPAMATLLERIVDFHEESHLTKLARALLERINA